MVLHHLLQMESLAILPYPLEILDCEPHYVAGQTDCNGLMDHRTAVAYFIIIVAFVHQNANLQQYLANDFLGGRQSLMPYVHYYFGHCPRSAESCLHFDVYIHLYLQLVYYLTLSSSPNSSFSFYSHLGAYATCSVATSDL